MKQILDFAPIAIFVLAYWQTDIYIATGAMMAASVVQIAFLKIFTGKVEKQLLITVAVIMVFGSLTLVFRNPTFIYWKPTVINWIFALVLVGSQYVGSENLLKKMMGKQLPLPDKVWRNLSLGWGLGFFIAGLLNLFVAYGFEEATWVKYKLIGGPLITLTYIGIMMAYLIKGKYINTSDAAKQDNSIAKKD